MIQTQLIVTMLIGFIAAGALILSPKAIIGILSSGTNPCQ